MTFFSRIAAVLPALVLAAAPLAAWAQKPPVFVLNSLDASVSMIDPVTWKETKRIPTGKEPHHLYLTPDEKSLMIANAAGDSLLFLDAAAGVAHSGALAGLAGSSLAALG